MEVFTEILATNPLTNKMQLELQLQIMNQLMTNQIWEFNSKMLYI